MKKLVVATLFLILVISSSASAFDGMRKGFVLGGGLGFGPVAKVSPDVPNSEDLDNSGIALNFLIGYAWDEQNMIVFLRDGVVYSEELNYGDDVNIVQGFSGIGYYHYFGLQGKSFFITGGLGLQDWTALDSDYTNPDPGFGFLIGGGYEFARHIQVYSSLSFGKTSDEVFGYEFDFDHTQFLITVSAVAF